MSTLLIMHLWYFTPFQKENHIEWYRKYFAQITYNLWGIRLMSPPQISPIMCVVELSLRSWTPDQSLCMFQLCAGAHVSVNDLPILPVTLPETVFFWLPMVTPCSMSVERFLGHMLCSYPLKFLFLAVNMWSSNRHVSFLMLSRTALMLEFFALFLVLMSKISKKKNWVSQCLQPSDFFYFSRCTCHSSLF